jgi:hypothetical protein
VANWKLIPKGTNTYLLGTEVAVRYWVVVSALLVLPALAAIGGMRRRRRIVGLCRNCGYDLRASKDRCPECGKAIETQRNLI